MTYEAYAVSRTSTRPQVDSARKFGRPAKLNADQAALARRMEENGETAATNCWTLGIGRTTLYRYLAESGED
ncbi:MAG TPA: helix-turn-helix domain-containing protein [Mycobacterium sp.]